MSTRAYVRIVKKGSEPVHFHHHCDGYPSGVGEDLVSLLKEYSGEWNPEQLGKFINSRDDDFEFIDHGPSWDHEYFYVIDCDRRELSGYYKGITSASDTCDIDGYDKLFIDGNIFDGRSLDSGDTDEWEEFRRNAAKDFATAILANPTWMNHFEAHSDYSRFQVAYFKDVVVGNAISYADALIEKLRNGA